MTGDALDLDVETWRRVLDEATGDPPAPGRVAELLADRDLFDVGDVGAAYDAVEAAVERGVLVEDEDAGAFGGVRLDDDSAGVRDDSGEPARADGGAAAAGGGGGGGPGPDPGADDRATLVDRLDTVGLLDVEGGRFAECVAGGKASHTHADADARLDEPPAGNYAVEATARDPLVLVDVDLYDDAPDGGEPTAGGEQALDALPDTFTVESPHGGRHRYYRVREDDLGRTAAAALDEAFGKPNPQPSFGEVRAATQYVVGPGSVLDDCDKEWCDSCADPEGGHYRVVRDRPLATIDADDLVDALGLDPALGDDSGGEGDQQDGAQDGDDGDGGNAPHADDATLSDREKVERAREGDDKLDDLLNGRWRAAGYTSEDGSGDRSRGECALAQKLGYYLDADKRRVEAVLDHYAGSGWKWSDRGDDYRTSVLEAVDKVDDTADWSTPPRPPEPEDPGGDDGTDVERVEDSLASAILDSPDAWIDADEQTWTVRDTSDHTADETADAIRDGDLPGDAYGALADAVLAGDVDDEVGAALRSWRSDPDAWDVRVARSVADTDLSPRAIAADAGCQPAALNDLSVGEKATHVVRRLRRHDRYHFLVRVQADAHKLFRYDHETGTWREDGEAFAKSLADQALDVAYTTTVGSLVVERLKNRRETWVDMGDLGADPGTLAVANGLLDTADRSLRSLRPDDHVLTRLPVAYDADAECPRWREFLRDSVPNAEDRLRLQEFVGYTLMHDELPFHKALFLVGPHSSGKSTFLSTVTALLGDEATVSLAPQEITDEKFAGYGLVDAWANIRSDIPADLIENVGKFKEVVAGDSVKVEKKNEQPISINPTAKHLFAANTLPKASIDDDAFFRRILLVSFPDTVPREDRDPRLADKLTDELPGILNWALDGLDRLVEQGRFTGDYGPGDVRETWERWGQSVDRFKAECLSTDDPAAREPKKDVYDAYTRFCRAEGMPAETRQKFTSELKKAGEISDGARVEGARAFTGVELLDDRVPEPVTDPEDVEDGGDSDLRGY